MLWSSFLLIIYERAKLFSFFVVSYCPYLEVCNGFVIVFSRFAFLFSVFRWKICVDYDFKVFILKFCHSFTFHDVFVVQRVDR